MANEKHLDLIKQGVEVWNQWRQENPEEKPDLSKSNLRGADLRGVNLFRAVLLKTNLSRAALSKANLREADLSAANLNGTTLFRADLFRTNFSGAVLTRAVLSGADLREAILREAILYRAGLIGTNLSGANITGTYLFGTVCDDWIIDGIKCEYVFWDISGKKRDPKDRDFRPGEFEEQYKHLPTIEYYFEQGFTSLDAAVMAQVVQAINKRCPEFELKLDTFHSRGQPHAVFTVIHKEYAEEALKQIATNYETRLVALKDKEEQLMELIARLASNP